MQKSDKALVSWWDFPLVLVLLTRFPIPRLPDHAFARQAQAVWAFPVAGLAAGLPACGIGWAGLNLGLPGYAAATLAIAAMIALTGAMHEDGLADTVDGLWGGFSPDRRLEIMKDSHIGTYGVLALILAQALRISAVTTLLTGGVIAGLLAASVFSRAVMPMLMWALPPARSSGLSHSVGTPSGMSALGALVLGAGLSLVLLGGTTILPGLMAAVAALGVALVARAKIGGQTGDILGATQSVSEITFLLTLCAVY